MKKNIIISLFVVLAGGCNPAAAPTVAPIVEEASASYPLPLTDDIGREITIEAEPERIVSLLPSNTEILFAVGAGDQVVGVTSYCNYPPEATTREQVGGITNKSLSLEAIIALEPDLVVAGGAQDEIIPILEETGLVVLVLRPATLDDIYTNIELVGRATNHFEQAKALTADMRRRAEVISDKVATIPADARPTVFYEVWDDPLMTAGPNTFIGQLVEMAGGKSIFADVAEDWPQVSAEVIVERNPAVILGPESHADALVAEKVATRPGWANIEAVQSERIYLLDSDMVSRPGPRIVDILEQIAHELHPGLF